MNVGPVLLRSTDDAKQEGIFLSPTTATVGREVDCTCMISQARLASD